MSGDKQKYNNEMRRAKSPKHPPGGSTKVHGQAVTPATQTVRAHMAHQVEDAESQDTDADEETAAILADILRETEEQNESDMSGYLPPDYGITHATALMMDDIILLHERHSRHQLEKS